MYAANVTFSIRGNKWVELKLGELCARLFPGSGQLCLLVSSEQLHRGITANSKQGQTKVLGVCAPSSHTLPRNRHTVSYFSSIFQKSKVAFFFFCYDIRLFPHKGDSSRVWEILNIKAVFFPYWCHEVVLLSSQSKQKWNCFHYKTFNIAAVSLLSPTCLLSSICSCVICLKVLGAEYREGCYGVWPHFPVQYLYLVSPRSAPTICVCSMFVCFAWMKRMIYLCLPLP